MPVEVVRPKGAEQVDWGVDFGVGDGAAEVGTELVLGREGLAAGARSGGGAARSCLRASPSDIPSHEQTKEGVVGWS